jgi:hypothetical protein
MSSTDQERWQKVKERLRAELGAGHIHQLVCAHGA